MQINKATVDNYKSFGALGTLSLRPGFNVLTGQNSAGKTALLETLSLQFANIPHRSIKTIPSVNSQPKPISTIAVEIEITNAELMEIIRTAGSRIYRLPLPPLGHPIAKSLNATNWNQNERRSYAEWFLRRESFRFNLTFRGSGAGAIASEFPTHRLHPASQATAPQYNFATITYEPGNNFTFGQIESHDSIDIGLEISGMLPLRVYRFNAERFNRGRYRYGDSAILNPDAANLPEVLNRLQHNVARFRAYNDLVSEVLPQIRLVSVRPVEADNEIVVWTIDPQTGRDDLAISLNSSGTGVGQVLAILYVTSTANYSRIILIDEPQSFLHPGAARKLIEVLKRYSQHQFVIATHSPTIISAANSQTITILIQQGAETTFQNLDAKVAEDVRTALLEVGAKLSDVFGADSILWVEGPTEYSCFPIILEKVAGCSLMGTSIQAVRRTGDIERDDAGRIFEIYNSLSSRSSLIPPAVGFIFDRECRTEQERNEINHRGRGTVFFTPRRMFENYLIDADAIASITSDIQGFRASPVTVQEVQDWLKGAFANIRYFDPLPIPKPGEIPTEINGAKLLNDLFAHFSDNRVRYEKIRHGTLITQWICDNKPEALREVADLIQTALTIEPR